MGGSLDGITGGIRPPGTVVVMDYQAAWEVLKKHLQREAENEQQDEQTGYIEVLEMMEDMERRAK